ncbi:MAG: hypothetical protein KDK24_07870 [Pseudooceanicola sp.]|nr:hypothetical protein [Pseudooceanicola sp.]
MATLTGDANSNSLFGTKRDDLLLGMGGRDVLNGAGGDDTITGFGEVYGGNGNDHFDLVALNYPIIDLAYTKFDMGAGRDRVILSQEVDTTVASAIMYGESKMGAGRDELVMAAPIQHGAMTLGTGADTAYLMSQASELYLTVFLGNYGDAGDAQPDVINIDGHSSATLRGFGENDVLAIYDCDLTVSQLRARTVFDDANKTNLKVLLDDGYTIQIVKSWTGYLTASQLEFHNETLQVQRNVLIGNDAVKTKVLFGSGADERLVATNGRALFLGSGDDIGIGRGTDDLIRGEKGNDRLVGNDGDHILRGGIGDDLLLGGDGNDVIYTGIGNDRVAGGLGADVIHVERGVDVIRAGAGADRIVFDGREIGDRINFVRTPAQVYGEGGRDHFVFSNPDTVGGVVIEDFSTREKLDFSALFDALAFATPEAEAKAAADILNSVRDTSPDGELGAHGTYIYSHGVTIILAGVSADSIDAGNFLF